LETEAQLKSYISRFNEEGWDALTIPEIHFKPQELSLSEGVKLFLIVIIINKFIKNHS